MTVACTHCTKKLYSGNRKKSEPAGDERHCFCTNNHTNTDIHPIKETRRARWTAYTTFLADTEIWGHQARKHNRSPCPCNISTDWVRSDIRRERHLNGTTQSLGVRNATHKPVTTPIQPIATFASLRPEAYLITRNQPVIWTKLENF